MYVNATDANGYHGVANGNLSHSSDLSDSSDSDSDSNDSGIHNTPFTTFQWIWTSTKAKNPQLCVLLHIY